MNLPKYSEVRCNHNGICVNIFPLFYNYRVNKATAVRFDAIYT